MRAAITTSAFFLLLLMGTLCMAQPGPPGLEYQGEAAKARIKEAKKKFLAEELALSEKQQREFWPIYDQFDAEMEANHEKIKGLKRGFNVKSDGQLNNDIGHFFDLKEEAVGIERKYFQKFKEVLSIRQVAALYQSEQKFKRWLVEQIRQRRQGRGGGFGGPRGN